MKAANSHRTGLVQSMRDFGASVAVMVMSIHESDVSLILRSRVSGVSKDESRMHQRASWFETALRAS